MINNKLKNYFKFKRAKNIFEKNFVKIKDI